MSLGCSAEATKVGTVSTGTYTSAYELKYVSRLMRPIGMLWDPMVLMCLFNSLIEKHKYIKLSCIE
jgi:hypothetical protein